MTRPAHATVNDREARLRRSLLRLGFDLVDAERGNFYIRRQGSKVNETADLFGLDLTGVERDAIRDRSGRHGKPPSSNDRKTLATAAGDVRLAHRAAGCIFGELTNAAPKYGPNRAMVRATVERCTRRFQSRHGIGASERM